jgi:hypothetical protein
MSTIPDTANEPLAIAARKAVKDPAFEGKPGYCQRFVRQVMQSIYGRRYNAYYQDSARETAEEFREHGIGFKPNGDTAYHQGDILYKETGSGGFGHVGIWVGRVNDSDVPLVAENSSTRIGRVSGAKGYRTMAQFNADGGVSWVVRIPAPVPTGDSVA